MAAKAKTATAKKSASTLRDLKPKKDAKGGLTTSISIKRAR
jgi:hypothetical protein